MLAMAKKLWKEEDGLGTLEILLIVAVLVAITIVFRKTDHWLGHADFQRNQ